MGESKRKQYRERDLKLDHAHAPPFFVMPAGNLCHRQTWKVRIQPTISVTITVSKNINIWWTVWLLRVLAACQCGGTTSMFSRKCLSWITSDYTAHLQTTVSVRREYHLSDLLMWITMASVFDSVFFSWDSLRVILMLFLFLKKNRCSIRPSEFISLHSVV